MQNLFISLSNNLDNDNVKDYYDVFYRLHQSNIDFFKSNIEVFLNSLFKLISKSPINSNFIVFNKSLLLVAPYSFDAYMLYLEHKRDPKKRFYQPRRKQLLRFTKALQKLADNELDEIFLTCPPRIGKSTIILFYLTWCIGRNTESSNLYSSYSDMVVKTFYEGILEIINDYDTYAFKDVFPEAEIVRTDGKAGILDLTRKKKYASITCRSVDGTLNGACDCDGILIADDLIEGYEESLSPTRLFKKNATVENNLLTRCKQNAKKLWIGTRWSIQDPMGKRLVNLVNEPTFANVRYELLEVPALDENGESNFNYLYNLGFSTEHYIRIRASFENNNDLASWLAQYMCSPIERQGTLFTPDSMNFFNGDLPVKQPDEVIMCIDPAFGGGDYTAAPIAYVYDDEYYIVDVVFTNEDKKVARDNIVKKITKYKVNRCQIEATKMQQDYADIISNTLKSKGYKCNISTKPAYTGQSKVQRIFNAAPDIRDNCYFLQNKNASKEYQQFMSQVYSFKTMGKNLHDDAPDSLAQLLNMKTNISKIEFIRRPF